MRKRTSYLVVDGKVVEVAAPAPDFSALDAAVAKAAAKPTPPIDLTHPSGRPIGNYL